MRIIPAIIALLLVVSCAKPVSMVSVSFTMERKSGPITRSFADDMETAFAETAPVGPFSLRAVSTTNNLHSYNITTGVSLMMAAETYTITGSGDGIQFGSNNTVTVLSTPSWAVSCTQDVTEDGEYGIPARYTCAAIVVDKTKAEKVVFQGNPASVEVTTFGGSGDAGVVYVTFPKAVSGSNPLWVYVYSSDEMYGDTRLYKLCTTGSTDETLLVKNGYWYQLDPGEIEVSSGSFGVEFPTWKTE